MTLTASRIRTCVTHHLRPRCPACDSERHVDGFWPMRDVPKGTAEWLRNAARFYDSLGPISATEFAEAIAADLREVA